MARANQNPRWRELWRPEAGGLYPGQTEGFSQWSEVATLGGRIRAEIDTRQSQLATAQSSVATRNCTLLGALCMGKRSQTSKWETGRSPSAPNRRLTPPAHWVWRAYPRVSPAASARGSVQPASDFRDCAWGSLHRTMGSRPWLTGAWRIIGHAVCRPSPGFPSKMWEQKSQTCGR